MRGVFGFSHDRGRYQMGMNLDSLYWGMLHYQLFNATRRSKPNVLNEHPRRISGVSLFTEKSEFFNRIRIVGPHCAVGEMKLEFVICRSIRFIWGDF